MEATVFKTPVDSEDNVWLSSSRGFQAGGPPPPLHPPPPSPPPPEMESLESFVHNTRTISERKPPHTLLVVFDGWPRGFHPKKSNCIQHTPARIFSLSLSRFLTARNSGVNQATRGSNKYLFDYANSIVCFTAGNSDEEKDVLSWMMARNLSMQNIFSVFPVEFFLF